MSLFDGSNCGIQLKGRPVFSVQYHPEASPGPQDSHYLFDRFVALMRSGKAPLSALRLLPYETLTLAGLPCRAAPL